MASPLFKVAPEEPGSTVPWVGTPPVTVQQLWFALQRHAWSSLVVVPADERTDVADFGPALHAVGRLAMGERLRLLDARKLELDRTAPLILDMSGAARPDEAPGRRVLVLVDSVLENPAAVPVVLAADAAVLCIDVGRTGLARARETLAVLGTERFLGCVTLPPA